MQRTQIRMEEKGQDVTYRTSSEPVEDERRNGVVTRDGGTLQEIEIATQD